MKLAAIWRRTNSRCKLPTVWNMLSPLRVFVWEYVERKRDLESEPDAA
jgi:hypothetical protein